MDFEQQVPVFLQFRAMSAPVSISVPGYVMRYLDTFAERKFATDGAVVYRQPADILPEMRVIPVRRTVRMAATA